MAKQISIPFQFTGRYFIEGDLNSTTKHVLMVFHGQGQLAEYFVRKFESLKEKEYCIIAPEGLHHYYVEGFSGRVGASWMTKENRLVSIANYLNFLDSVYKSILEQAGKDIRLHVLGFSQGTATVSRWIASSSFPFKQLILWGGALPPDLDKEAIKERMEGKSLTHVVGDDDPYINSHRLGEMKTLVNEYALSSHFLHYKGGHDIDKEVLLNLM